MSAATLPSTAPPLTSSSLAAATTAFLRSARQSGRTGCGCRRSSPRSMRTQCSTGWTRLRCRLRSMQHQWPLWRRVVRSSRRASHASENAFYSEQGSQHWHCKCCVSPLWRLGTTGTTQSSIHMSMQQRISHGTYPTASDSSCQRTSDAANIVQHLQVVKRASAGVLLFLDAPAQAAALRDAWPQWAAWQAQRWRKRVDVVRPLHVARLLLHEPDALRRARSFSPVMSCGNDAGSIVDAARRVIEASGM